MNRVPEDFHTITPQLVVKGVAEAIDWYTKALGANELLRNLAQDGKSIMHSELLLGDSRFFVVDEFQGSMASPVSLGGTSITLHLYVQDVDALFGRAVAALYGDVEVAVRGDSPVGGGGTGEAGKVDGVDADAHDDHHPADATLATPAIPGPRMATGPPLGPSWLSGRRGWWSRCRC